MTTIGERLTSLRENKSLTQAQVAEIIGVDRTSYAKYETNVNKPTRKLKELSELFDVSSDYIMCLTDMPNKFVKGLLGDPEKLGRTEQYRQEQATNPIPTTGLSPKEERDIESDLEDMMNSMASAAYEGDNEAEEDVEALKAALRLAMIQAKKIAKKKYTPKKYRRD